MSYFSVSVANSIIKLAKERNINDLSPMKLQQLMYFVQLWHVKKFNEFLIDDWFSRWPLGPVIPSIYHQLKYYGPTHINDYIWLLSPNKKEAIVYTMGNKPSAFSLLNEVLNIYGDLDVVFLLRISQLKNSAWSRGKIGSAITKQDFLDTPDSESLVFTDEELQYQPMLPQIKRKLVI